MADSSEATLRQRKVEKDEPVTPEPATTLTPPQKKKKSKKSSKQTDDEDDIEYENRWVDFARVLTLFFFLSCGLSYLISNGESFFWSMKVPPKYLRTEWWKSQWVCNFTLYSVYKIESNLLH